MQDDVEELSPEPTATVGPRLVSSLLKINAGGRRLSMTEGSTVGSTCCVSFTGHEWSLLQLMT